LAKALRQTDGMTELRDEGGRVVGFFNPSRSEADAELIRLAEKHFDLKEAEERYRRERGTGITTAELLEHLRSLAPDQ
jgi:hypothetical protein